jgi:hypothetical protein
MVETMDPTAIVKRELLVLFHEGDERANIARAFDRFAAARLNEGEPPQRRQEFLDLMSDVAGSALGDFGNVARTLRTRLLRLAEDPLPRENPRGVDVRFANACLEVLFQELAAGTFA